MSIMVRNKNRYIYSVKLKLKKYLHSHPILLERYLRLKALFINRKVGSSDIKNSLFNKIYIETISYCNNDCAFCPASTNNTVKKPEYLMAQDLYLKILEELKNLSFRGTVAFHCNNEPLLDERLVSWVKMARASLKSNFFYIYTNGILLNVDLANQLFDAGLNRIIVNNYNDRYDLLTPIRNLIDSSKALHGEVILNYRLKSEYLGNRAGQSLNAKNYLRRPLNIICKRPLLEIVIGYDGTVPLCCADGLWKISLGNVVNSSLKDVWFCEAFSKIKSALIKGDRTCTEICKVCDVFMLEAPKGMSAILVD